MSRIGAKPIPVPNGVNVTISENEITVKGPKGQLTQPLRSEVKVSQEDGHIVVDRRGDDKNERAMHGLTRSLIQNMVTGVTEGYEKILEVIGVGYRAQKQGETLVLNVGYSHAVEIVPRDGIQFDVGQDTNTRSPIVTVRGIDKQLVGQTAAEVRRVKKPEPYKGKGIRYRGEVVRRKAGKSASKVGGK